MHSVLLHYLLLFSKLILCQTVLIAALNILEFHFEHKHTKPFIPVFFLFECTAAAFFCLESAAGPDPLFLFAFKFPCHIFRQLLVHYLHSSNSSTYLISTFPIHNSNIGLSLWLTIMHPFSYSE